MAKSKDSPIKAIDYLAGGDIDVPGVVALFGDDSFLKRESLAKLQDQVLAGDDGEFSLTRFNGASIEPRRVFDELSTGVLFGSGRRLVVVDDADDFVSKNRPRLEDYSAKPSRSAVLVLLVTQWASNTRLYKAVAESGLNLDCKAPTERELPRWLVSWSKQRHEGRLSMMAAQELVDIIGPETGLLDQELAKLSAAAGKEEATPELVRELCGGWRVKTAWEMLDAAAAGDAADALRQLDRLLDNGEHPVGVLAQVATSLRRFAAATRFIQRQELAGHRPNLREALEAAGFKSFTQAKSEEQLRQIGRVRGAKLYRWLLAADRDLKGASQLPARVVMERLLVRMAKPQSASKRV